MEISATAARDDIERHRVSPNWSGAVIFGSLVFFSGQTAKGLANATDIRSQTAEVLRRIDDLLSTCSSDRSRLLSATIYLTDMANFGPMNEVWQRWVAASNPPARTTVEAKLAHPELLIEITVVAATRQN